MIWFKTYVCMYVVGDRECLLWGLFFFGESRFEKCEFEVDEGVAGDVAFTRRAAVALDLLVRETSEV